MAKTIEELSGYKFIKDWKKHQTGVFKQMFPDLEKKEFHKFLDDIIVNRITIPEAELHNNYEHRAIGVDLLGIIDWFDKLNPIAAGFGVFFKNQDQVLNPAAVMLDKFMVTRKQFKKEMEKYPEGSYEYKTYDRLQGTEKINANSYYGASGADSSNFFNLYTATSVTATGQSLISTTQQAFEAFMTNSVPFIDLDECFTYLENIRKEKHLLDDDFLPDIPVYTLVGRLEDMFYEYDEEQCRSALFRYIINQPQNIINRIYFKNNLYEFSKLPKIRGKLTTIVSRVDEFKNPNKTPDAIKSNMEDLWDFYREFVFYNHSPMNRINRLKHDYRKTVVVVDTDSNMLNLNPWVEFMYQYIIGTNYKLANRDVDQLRFICINIMCYVLTNMITEVLWKYTKDAKVPKSYRPRINMKNEFLFSRLILSEKKKRYISSIRLREGNEIFPEKVDIKGHDFVKSSTREDTRDYFKSLVKKELLQAKDIDIATILRELEKFEQMIMNSLKLGEKNFLIPSSVKELAAYDDPYKMQQIRGAIAWNYLYPSIPIGFPEKVDLIKMTLVTPEDAEAVKRVDPKMHEIIMRQIFGNREKKIADKGLKILAIPRSIPEIPQWLMPFIDYETIVNDNVSKFYSVLASLGIQTIKTSKREYFSNILKI